MDALHTAAPLARALLALGEGGRIGELAIEQRAREARLSVVGGRLVALLGVEVEPLGDALRALGGLDVAAQPVELAGPAFEPIGARLVAAGASSPMAVALALQRQRLSGLATLLRWPAVRVAWRGGARVAPAAGASFDLVAALWALLFALVGELPEPLLAQLAGSGELVLSAAGQRRVRALVRASESGELAALRRLAALSARPVPARTRHAPSESVIVRALGARPAAEHYGLRALLRVLGAAVEKARPEDACALLLRKRCELTRNVGARRLLDLPEQAGAAHARKALRRLAQHLHPDRFQAGDARLHAISAEVMGALARAERELRCGPSAHGS